MPMDKNLKKILRSCSGETKELLEKEIKDLPAGVYQWVLKNTMLKWDSFLSFLLKRGTVRQEDVNKEGILMVGGNSHDNMDKILTMLHKNGKTGLQLVDYLYQTKNYSALEAFHIHIQLEEPPPVPPTSPHFRIVDNGEIRHWKDIHIPPVIDKQPPERLKVHTGKSVVLCCHARGAKKYQWFYVDHGTHREMQDGEQGSYKIQNARLSDAGMYYCKVGNSYGCVNSHDVRLTVCEGTESYLAGYSRNDPLVITSQPESMRKRMGEKAVFMCNAVGYAPLTFQWYRKGTPLHGEVDRKLTVVTDKNSCGSYTCVVRDGCDRTATSSTASLEMLFTPVTDYTATSKVALLIGNGHYKCHGDLLAIENDIPKLSGLLHDMGFKVVCFYDLTAREMRNAVRYFKSLMVDGVYAVVYLVGHGFCYNNNNYLLAWDAKSDAQPDDKDCICIEWILNEMEKKWPALKAIFLDICRRGPESGVIHEPGALQVTENRNTAICYATSRNLKAYEYQDEDPQSFFVSCILKVLDLDEPFEMICLRIKQLMAHEEKIQNLQYPILESALADARSLTDPVDFSGRTAYVNRSLEMWEKANKLPHHMTFGHDGIVHIHLDFMASVTNELRVCVTVMQENAMAKISIDPEHLPVGLTASFHRKPRMPGDRMTRTMTILRGLQRLQEKQLMVYLLITDVQENVTWGCHRIALESRPMISCFELWKPEEDFTKDIEAQERLVAGRH